MTFTLPSTSKRIITIVVATLAIISILTIGTLSVILIMGAKPDPTLLTAYVGIAGSSLTGLTALLANTRSTPGTDTDMPKGTIIQDTPTPVQVVNQPSEPVPTEETTGKIDTQNKA